MGGIRLHHPNAAFRGCTFVVELDQPYTAPQQCPSCSDGKALPVVHERKAIHLRLDTGGDVIVSQRVYERLQEVFLAGLEYVNEVPDPPPLFVGAVDSPQHEVVFAPLNADEAQRFGVPGTSKYDWRPPELILGPKE